MDERGANIDLLFRNGLKDYEVLPPQGAWDKINPAIRRKPYLFYLRVAAAMALFTSLGVVAWMLGRDAVYDNAGSFVVLNIGKAEPVKIADYYISEYTVASAPTTSRRITPVSAVPEKAEYNSNLLDLGNQSYSGIITQPRSDMLTGPQKADISSVPKNINPGKFDMEMPEHYPGPPLPDKRWSISAMASPTYYSKTGSGNEEFMKMAASENAAASYAGGIGLSYRINKRFSIQTGLYYSSYGQKIGGVNSFAGFSSYSDAKGNGDFEVMTTNGPVQTYNNDVFLSANGEPGRVLTQYNNDVFDPNKANLSYVDNALVQNFSYIQMPFVVRYKLLDRNLDFNLLGGISYDFLVGNNAFAKSDGAKFPVGSTEGLNTLLFSSSVGMGMEYNFSEKISLNLEPTLRYFVNPFNDAAGTQIHPYSFGIFSGFSYKF